VIAPLLVVEVAMIGPDAVGSPAAHQAGEL